MLPLPDPNPSTDSSCLIPYLAGFFDGEGCVMIQCYQRKIRNGTRSVYSLSIAVSQLTEHDEPLQILHKLYGGTLRERKMTNPKWRPISTWSAKGYGADKALRDMLPYLKVKHKVAFLGIVFQSAAEQSIEAKRRGAPLKFDFSLVCSGIKQAVTHFNIRGTGNSQASSQIN